MDMWKCRSKSIRLREIYNNFFCNRKDRNFTWSVSAVKLLSQYWQRTILLLQVLTRCAFRRFLAMRAPHLLSQWTGSKPQPAWWSSMAPPAKSRLQYCKDKQEFGSNTRLKSRKSDMNTREVLKVECKLF